MKVEIVELYDGDVIGYHFDKNLPRGIKMEYLKYLESIWNNDETKSELGVMSVDCDITVFRRPRPNVKDIDVSL